MLKLVNYGSDPCLFHSRTRLKGIPYLGYDRLGAERMEYRSTLQWFLKLPFKAGLCHVSHFSGQNMARSNPGNETVQYFHMKTLNTHAMIVTWQSKRIEWSFGFSREKDLSTLKGKNREEGCGVNFSASITASQRFVPEVTFHDGFWGWYPGNGDCGK